MSKVKRSFDLKFKLDAVNYAELHNNRQAAVKFQVDRACICKWRKQKSDLEHLLHTPDGRTKKTLPGRGNKVASNELEQVLVNWVTRMRSAGRKVSRSMLQNKAREVFGEVEDSRTESFNASAGWADRFMRRNGFAAGGGDGASTSTPMEEVVLPHVFNEDMEVQRGRLNSLEDLCHGLVMISEPSSRSRQSYSVEFKLKAIELADKTTANGAARALQLDSKQIRDWRNQKEKLQLLLKSSGGQKRKTLSGRGNKVASREMEEVLIAWVVELRSKGVRVTRRMLQDKAREVFGEVEDSRTESFNASVGWADGFMRRNGFFATGTTGSSMSSTPAEEVPPQESKDDEEEEEEKKMERDWRMETVDNLLREVSASTSTSIFVPDPLAHVSTCTSSSYIPDDFDLPASPPNNSATLNTTEDMDFEPEWHDHDDQSYSPEPPPPPPPSSSPCLICSSPETICWEESASKQQFIISSRAENSSEEDGDSAATTLNPHMYSIFVLRKLLNLPKVECEGLLASMLGVHPGDWYRLCGSCSSLAGQCLDVYHQMSLLQRKIIGYRRQAYKSLQQSFIADESIQQDESVGIMCAREAVRDYFKDFLPSIVKNEVDDHCHSGYQDCEEEEEEQDDFFLSFPNFGQGRIPATTGPNLNCVRNRQIILQKQKNKLRRAKTPSKLKTGPERSKSNVGTSNPTTNCVDDDDDHVPEPQDYTDDGDDYCPSKSDNSEEEPLSSPPQQPPKSAKRSKKYVSTKTRSLQNRKMMMLKLRAKTSTGPKTKSKKPKKCDNDEDEEGQGSNSNTFFQCEKCEFSCWSSALQNHHIRMHKLDDNVEVSEFGTFICNLCPPPPPSSSSEEQPQRVWTTRGEIHLHLRSTHGEHLGLHVFPCTSCSKHFNTKTQLKLHTAKMHDAGRNTFHCDQCGIFFSNGSRLARHTAARHNTEEARKKEPEICDTCGNKFSTLQGLQTHKVVTHGGLSSEELARYRRKLGKCTRCDFEGSGRGQLRKHMKETHPDIFTFQCSKCSMSYSRLYDLQKHEKKTHHHHHHQS